MSYEDQEDCAADCSRPGGELAARIWRDGVTSMRLAAGGVDPFTAPVLDRILADVKAAPVVSTARVGRQAMSRHIATTHGELDRWGDVMPTCAGHSFPVREGLRRCADCQRWWCEDCGLTNPGPDESSDAYCDDCFSARYPKGK